MPLFPRLVVFLASAAALAAAPSPRSVYNFNPGWKLEVGDPAGAEKAGFDDSGWKSVTLPRAWNEDDAFRVPIDQHRTGVAWYRKQFQLPAGSEGRKVFLEFEGVRQGAEFWLNDRRIGRHENGVMAFGLDISDAVKAAPAVNVLAVRTDNAWDYRESTSGGRYQWSDRNFNANFGGIPKNVRLHVMDRVYQTLPLYSHLGTTGVYVYATDFDFAGGRAAIHAESEVRNETREPKTFVYRVRIADADGAAVADFSAGPFSVPALGSCTAAAQARVDHLHFWSWGYGCLYTVTTTLEADGRVFDTVDTRTGFRKTEFADGMVRLNGRALQVKGYAQRTSNEWPALGVSVPPWLSDYSNGLMVESGANLVRWMHITPWKQDVESCDRVGLLQMLPAGDSERDAQGRQWAQRLELMRDAIIYNRNNPSVLVYEAGNKGVSEEHMAEMKALRDRYDPHGGRAAGSREMLDSRLAEYGGEMLYVNKSARLPLWATEYSRDEGLRKYWDEFSPPYHKDGDGPLYRNAPAPDYNRNQDSHALEDVRRWYDYWRERPGTGRRVNAGGLNIVFSDTNTHYRGAENYRRSGEVDALRIPKDGFWAHQVMWDGWVDVEQPRLHVLGHWNYAAGTTKPVYVVSSAERVELFLNGRSLGAGARSFKFLFAFPAVAWEPGELRAVGYDAHGARVCETSRITAGEPAALRLSALTGPGGLKADGADLALFEVEVVDARGRRCPTALTTVDFELDGPAEWRGGIAQGPDNFILARSLPVECGVNRVLVRAGTEPGKIVLRATAGGLKPAAVELTSMPAAQVAGLSESLPAAGLRPAFRRGPTPQTPSFVVSRQAIGVTKVTAGSNAAAARQSCDDNEETSWSSEGGLGAAWIEFELERAARVDEVTLKLVGWRERAYPLIVTVDGQEVFRGVTSRSLGYVTLPLKPAAGRRVRLALAGSGSLGDAFRMTELENQKNAGTGAERLGQDSLGIVEAEFYEKVR